MSYFTETFDTIYRSFSDTSIQEGKILDKMREFISGYNWKKKAQQRDYKALTEDRYKYTRKVIHSKSELDRLYNSEAYFIECVSGDEELCQIMSNLLGANFEIKQPLNIFVVNGKDFNKAYDLYGNNAYQDDVHHVIIPLDDVGDKSAYKAKAVLKARYFRDVVDNNEYREYMAGRHKKSAQIQWIIDRYGD